MTAPGTPRSGAKPLRPLTSMTRVVWMVTGALSLLLVRALHVQWPPVPSLWPGPGGRLQLS